MTLYAPRPQPHLPIHQRRANTSPDLFGTLIMEVVTPTGQATAPELHGWDLRSWPVARLGDATLEASPIYPHLDAGNLREALAQAGYAVLGPIRQRK